MCLLNYPITMHTANILTASKLVMQYFKYYATTTFHAI